MCHGGQAAGERAGEDELGEEAAAQRGAALWRERLWPQIRRITNETFAGALRGVQTDPELSAAFSAQREDPARPESAFKWGLACEARTSVGRKVYRDQAWCRHTWCRAFTQ